MVIKATEFKVKINNDTIKKYVKTRRENGATNQELKDDMKNMYRCKAFNMEQYCFALDEIYKEG